MISYTQEFLFNFLLTIATETVVLVFLVKKLKLVSVNQKSLIFGGIFASFATIPYVWYIFPILLWQSFSLFIVVSEIFAVITEALFYLLFFKTNIKIALLISLICNIASFGLGLLINI